MQKLDYAETYSRLNMTAATVVFFKKTGEVRVMLATRNSRLCYLAGCGDKVMQLNSRDKRCTIANGTIGCMDLVLGEVRAFGIDRVIELQWTDVDSVETLDGLCARVQAMQKAYEAHMEHAKSLDGMESASEALSDITEGLEI